MSSVRLEVEGAVATVTLTRAAKLNALTRPCSSSWRRRRHELERDEALSAS